MYFTTTLHTRRLTTALAPDIAEPFGYFLHAVCTGNTDKVPINVFLYMLMCSSIY